MELHNCPECGRLFVYVNRNLCPACLEREEEYFKAVEKFLEDSPGATISEVSAATGVPEAKIIYFLREGRLITTGTNLVLECERCGKPIRTGHYCEECRRALGSSFKGVQVEKAEPPDTGRGRKLHTAELIRRERKKG